MPEDKENTQPDIAALMHDIGQRAQAAARVLAHAAPEAKTNALLAVADAIDLDVDQILTANATDMQKGRERELSASFLDRLELNAARIASITQGIRQIAHLPDPVGATIAEWDVPSGLNIKRVRTPLGVIGIIFESRPNVTADAGALSLKSGNAAILRGGSDSFYSSNALAACFVAGLKQAGLPQDAVQMVPTTDRAAVGEMLKGLDGAIDVIVPRGGKGLVARVQSEARVPVFSHLEGICHVYVDKDADLKMAVEIVLNSKMRRTSVCGAAETLLVHKDVVSTHLSPIIEALTAAGCEIRGDKTVTDTFDQAIAATQEDWHSEYSEPIISVRVVDNLDQAIEHISTFSSHHTEAIVTGSKKARERFFARVDSAILMHNASTQYADGGEFGMGAEIGIATGKMHARGPVGVEQLTSFKYLVSGDGQTRP